MNEENDGQEFSRWSGKEIDWESPLVNSRLHVELPFWLATPNGSVEVRASDCVVDIEYRNDVLGIFKNGCLFRDERTISQITAEGYPFAPDQAKELESIDGAFSRHFRTFVSIPVKCHSSVFECVEDTNRMKQHDAKLYLQSIAHASIRFINRLISAYRSSSFDPFVHRVSHWDLPIWHVSKYGTKKFHTFAMASYQVADQLPTADQSESVYFRVNREQIQNHAARPVCKSTEEMLDGWTCYYKGQYPDAIRKAVTAIEVAISELLSMVDGFREGRTKDDVQLHLEKLPFREQLDLYLRHTGRSIPGPLMHFSPEVNGIYLEKELESARHKRHKIVHESLDIDYEDNGPMFRIMETMSWLHGWLREAPDTSDPTNTVWHPINKQFRDVYMFEPVFDVHGIRLNPPLKIDPSEPFPKFSNDVQVRQLTDRAKQGSVDMNFCAQWVFYVLRKNLAHGRQSKNQSGFREGFWVQVGAEIRPFFLVSIEGLLQESDVGSIGCRMIALKKRNKLCGEPIVIVNHLAAVPNKEAIRIPCIADGITDLINELEFTVISFRDWISYACLITQDGGAQDFGLISELSKPGLTRFPNTGIRFVGNVRKIYPRQNVISVEISENSLAVGDLICFRDSMKTSFSFIQSIQIRRSTVSSGFKGAIIGIKINHDALKIAVGSELFKLPKPRIGWDPTVKTANLKMADNQWIRDIKFPIFLNGFGTYQEDVDLG